MHFISPELEAYCEQYSSAEPPHLKELAGETRAKVRMPVMLSGHLQGRFLSLLSSLVQPKKVLDIGTYTSYSAMCFAEALRPGGMVHTIDHNGQLAPMVQRYIRMAGMQDRITAYTGEALDIIPTIEGTFDLVFIDADKHNYCSYFDLLVDRVRPGGLIIADNVLWDGKVLDDESTWTPETAGLVAYARKVRSDARVSPVMVPLRDGLLVAMRK
ncbi:MAG: O-methyltransferase [Flavobacteriales bacterium]|nr:MAG: O-methyltransferase [Flavobacteriales bacterium]